MIEIVWVFSLKDLRLQFRRIPVYIQRATKCIRSLAHRRKYRLKIKRLYREKYEAAVESKCVRKSIKCPPIRKNSDTSCLKKNHSPSYV